MHGLGNQVSVAYKDLCPFPDVQLPAGFKMPKFDLYEGHGDPVAHLRGFCSKMRGAGGKDELLIAYFGQSLSGSALKWYTRQDPGRWYTWNDLAQAFIGHFQYNLEIFPDRLSLLKLEKKPAESFREFGFRWREQAARVDPPMRESEMVDYFLQTLEPTYFGHLVTSVGKSFNEVVKMGAMIEEGLKSNKILSYSALKVTTQAIQSGTGGVLEKKKKEEVVTVEASTWSFVRPGVKKQSLAKVLGPMIGAEGNLDKVFERVFAEVNMVEAGEGSRKADIQYIGPCANANNWEATPLPIRRES
ncbi:uncharacterized protein [Nicotiana sylvestris]|uniref:uncharacterized protein n=1 Tax=Nicotiana sylvestris TaxID=4096 RepID=UPI00388C8ECD